MEEIENIENVLIKGLGMNTIAMIGEEREWGGKKYKKEAPGHWKEIGGVHEVRITHDATQPERKGFGMYRSGASSEMGKEDVKKHISSVQQFKGDKRHGIQREYYPEGNIKNEINYEEGERHGDYIAYHPSGKIKGKATYENGKLHGKVSQYVENEKLFANRTKPHNELHKEENYVNGKKEGESKSYHKGTLHKVDNYKDNKKHGEQSEFNKQGLKTKIENYKEGKLHGETHYFDENTGAKEKTENYHEGRLAGKMVRYNKKTGNISEERTYNTNSELHGNRTFYDDQTGKKKQESNYQYGKLHGEENFYGKDGELEHTRNWKNDRSQN